MKACTTCGVEKPESEYPAYKNNGRRIPVRRCRACNRAHTASYERRKMEERKALSIQAKGRPCADCKKGFPHWIMQFDHLPQFEKTGTIAVMIRDRRTTIAALKEEIAKCDVVCANCHADRTYRRANGL